MLTKLWHFQRPGVLLGLVMVALLAFGRQLCVESYAESLRAPETQTLAYSADPSIFPNPERGFFKAFQPTGGGLVGQQDTPHPPLSTAELRALREGPEAITLIRDAILIPRRFWKQPISEDYLNELQKNFDAVRAAGLKTVPRFLYDWGMQNRDPDEAVISRHLEQLKPLLHKNADVIAWVQGGLFGGTGEQNASDHKYVYEKHPVAGSQIRWQGLSDAGKRLLLQELQAIPPERMMTVRYPRIKWDVLGWSTPIASSRARTLQTAFDGSNTARIGFYNDGFMGSPEHYAMFQLAHEAQFTAQDSAFVVHEGEISDASHYKLQPRQVVRDMAKYHFTALNSGGDSWAQVSKVWKRNGDFDEIARRMGYRFRLVKATLPQALFPSSIFKLRMVMKNEGFARAFNPRKVEIVLREKRSGAEYSISRSDKYSNRRWLPGPGETKQLQISAGIPRSMPAGAYEVFLNLPDPFPALTNRPEYSIRLANRQTWEARTGFNRFLHTLTIAPDAPGLEYSGRNFFVARKR